MIFVKSEVKGKRHFRIEKQSKDYNSESSTLITLGFFVERIKFYYNSNLIIE